MRMRLQKNGASAGILAAAGLALLVLAPLGLETFRAQLLGQYLCFAVAAVSLNLIWGYSGIMSLGHALFFGLGAYVMGYHLKLQDGSVPEFLVMNGFTSVPWFLSMLRSPWIAFPLVPAVPALVALLIGWPTFRSGIKGVYFTILSQALALSFYLLFINQQQFTGGTSGIYNFSAFFGIRASKPAMVYPMYYVTLAFLLGMTLLVRALLRTRTGQVLQAIRDGENRIKYLGYDPVRYKVFAFCLSAAMGGIGGALYAVQVGSVYPTYMSIRYSIMMVIWVGAGGLGTLAGPIVGAVLLNEAGALFSEHLPEAWWFVLGAILIGMVFLFPRGLAGLAPRAGRAREARDAGEGGGTRRREARA
jgi:urea transport system permease protein